MRTKEDIQKDQQAAMLEWGFCLAKAEEAKHKVFILGKEYTDLQKKEEHGKQDSSQPASNA